MNYIKHEVTDMDKSMVQCCVLCGKLISDYNSTARPKGDPIPKGFAAGSVYVSSIISTIAVKTTDEVKSCIKLF